ncbi:MAG: homocysteine S-methyltransferase family protein, partial [Coriobacteriales bacterium]
QGIHAMIGESMPDIEMRFNRDVVVVEGGIATMLARYGVVGLDCPELLNVTEPDLIEEIHRFFHISGAQCAITNTYGASRGKLQKLGLDDKLEDLNVEGVKRAKSCNPEHVLADIGQCSIKVKEDDAESYELAREQYMEQATALAKAEPDAIYIETMKRIEDAECAVSAAKDATGLPVFCSCVYDQAGMLGGTTPMEDAVDRLQLAGADVLGINCRLTPEQILDPAEMLIHATDLPVMIAPDVSEPHREPDGTITYAGSPDLMSEVAKQLRALGVQFIGTCCGSTPAYTGAIFAAVSGMDVVPRSMSKRIESGTYLF